MKNFTKEITNKTLFKPTRWILIALMFLLGTSGAWAYNQSAVDLYFDNSEAKWNACYVYIGHSTWTSCYPLTRVSGTEYLWKLAKADFNGGSTWNGATGWVLCYEKWWDNNGESIDKYTWHGAKNVTKKRTSAWSASYIYKTNGTVSVTSDGNTINAYNTTTVSNKNYTVTINTATGGTLTVQDYDNNTVSSGASKIYLTVLKFSATPSSGYELQAIQINDGTNTTTIAEADLATTHTLKSNVTITPVWEKTCSPSTSITSATLNQNGTISLVGNFTTCGTQYHGFQWRIKGQEWCAENSANSNSGYVTKNTNVDGEDTDTFTPTLGNTYEFRTYIYGSPWVYSSETVEVATCISPSATHFDYTDPANLTYNGSKKSASVTWKTGTGSGNITIYYKSSTGTYTTTAPTNLGTYTVAVKTTAGGNYCATDDYVVVGTFTIKGITPQASDFTYTTEKNYTGAVLSADVAWKTGTGTGAITTYYKVKGAADGTYTTDKPIDAGTYTIAVTTAVGGNYAAATNKIVLGDFTIVEVCEPITNLTWKVTSGAKATYCAGDKVQVTMTYDGNTATAYGRSGNNNGNIDFNVSSMASGVVYTFTIRNTGSIALTLTGCDGKKATTPTLTFNVMADPATPTVQVVNNIIKCGNDYTQFGQIKINTYNAAYTYKLGDDVVEPNNSGIVDNLTTAGNFTVSAINGCSVKATSAAFTITETNNKPTVTGTNSFQPGGSTTLTSDKGASTTWLALDGGDLNTRTGEKVVFTAKDKGTYNVQATYNGCSTTYTIKVQDDLYVWVRRPIEDEAAYDQFYHEDQNSKKGGDLFYKEFASLPGDYQQYNQGGKVADATCTDKDGYKWYGFIVSKTAIDNDYYFTVHAPNDGGKKGDSQKYGGYYTHTYATQLVDMESDLYFVMDESASGSSRGWNINAPVVVRASGDASFNGNNFADFVPLYVKDANICGKEVVSFEWQKSATENGAYTTYKSGEGINNIRTREAGWYRCVVTYHDASTATSNAIQVTNAGGTSYSFTSNLPIVMVNTNGVGFPNECTVSNNQFPSKNADAMKEKISVDVIIKKGNEVLYDRKARMNYRGSSSLNFKKKSYAFVSGQDSCVFDKSRHDYVKTKKAKMLNILGVANYEANDKDWVMYAATADPSMIRNRLVFDLYQKMRPNDWGVHSTYVELVVDGEYKGVYVFMDKITANENRVKIVDGTGFIVKWDKTDVADRYVDGNDKDSDEKTFATSRTGKTNIDTYDTKVDQLFEIEYPEKEDVVDEGGSWSGTVETIKQRFEDFETALEAKNYEQVRAIIDYDSWADWFIINEFTKNLDAYRASCIFTCKGQGYKIQAVPLWDQELSFNNAAANISGKGANSTSGLLIQNGGVYSDAFPAPFWFTGNKGTSITGGLLNDPCFVSLVKEKWATYTNEDLEGVLTAAKVNAMIDAYKADLGDINTAGTPINREDKMIPFNNSTNAGRGATSSCTGSKAIGYFGYGSNCGSAITHDQSITDIKEWIPSRISGLTSALDPLEGEALIFLMSPLNQDVTPWQTALVSVQAPSGYTYDIDYSAITAAGGEVTVNNNTYSIKLPRPDGWAIGGNGNNTLSIPYQISATIEIEDEGNTCGVSSPGGEDTKTATITLKDEIEDCKTPVTK